MAIFSSSATIQIYINTDVLFLETSLIDVNSCKTRLFVYFSVSAKCRRRDVNYTYNTILKLQVIKKRLKMDFA